MRLTVKQREDRLRRNLAKHGYGLRRGRVLSSAEERRYLIVDTVRGERVATDGLTLERAEAWAAY